MAPTPLLPYATNFILQYISPPSQLTQPLPPHLISKSLLQRHHFLQISPEDPSEYLCWPSPDRREVVDRLESYVMPVDDEAYATLSVRYLSDDEHSYAHVRLTDGLRIVFQWDELDGWKYHDAGLMPFPPGSHSSLGDATSLSLGGSGAGELRQGIDTPAVDDDAYWGAYGAGEGEDNDDDRSQDALAGQNKDTPTTEDDYWAQYGGVHGSGDSTIPSPIRKSYSKSQLSNPALTKHADEPVQISYANAHPYARDGDPPSPRVLADRIRTIPARENSLGSPTVPAPNLTGPVPHISPESQGLGIKGTHDDEAPLKDSIAAIYRLWKSGRRRQDGTTDSQVFMEVVEEALRQA
ncbi:hypothetical protein PLICRDRAFT_424501 [Plicaturopsis crispa FD-325 SS-3]|nr:hypothetical protein PLICRDRAFT_424501 [Plicaturopsis crispa FD-325 SS-3]